MRKSIICVIMMVYSAVSFGQVKDDEFPHNEVNWNIANTIIEASVEVGYEYFFDFNQSVGAKILVNDRPNYHAQKGGDEFTTNSFRLNYTYYFGDWQPGSGVYVQPFVKYRFGDFEETVDTGFDEITRKTDMNAFLLGVGVGYVWNFSNSFVIGPFANIARNFSSDFHDRFSTFDFNAGVNVGYRF